MAGIVLERITVAISRVVIIVLAAGGVEDRGIQVGQGTAQSLTVVKASPATTTRPSVWF
jgi:hypothetical protein